MKNIKLISLAIITLLLASCSSNTDYDKAALKFMEAAHARTSALNKFRSSNNSNYDMNKWDELSEKHMNSLIDLSCYSGNAISNSNRSSAQTQILNNYHSATLDKVKVARSALLQDGNVAFVEVEIQYEGEKWTEPFVVKKIDNEWKVEVFKWGSEFGELELEFDIKMASSKKAKDVSFEKFFGMFISDSEFQLSRVAFPVGGAYDGLNDSTVEFTAKNWRTISVRKVTQEDEKTYSEQWQTDGGAAGGNLKFELKKNGKWYLTEYNTFSL